MKLSIWTLVPVLTLALAGCTEEDERKPPGDPCKGNTDCADNLCHRSVCLPPNRAAVGKPCQGDHECYSFKCESGVCVAGTQSLGLECLDNSECASGLCSAGVCVGLTNPDGAVPDAGVDTTPNPDLPGFEAGLEAGQEAGLEAGQEAGPKDQGFEAEAGCTPGYACDDGDLKTYNDKCDSTGKCVGIPYSCASQLPAGSSCHQATYDGKGGCKPIIVKPNTCAIADTSIPPTYTCYTDGSSPASDPCKICDAKTNQTALVFTDGKGCVTTVAGTGSSGWTDGPASQATFVTPMALALDESKKRLYIADNMTHYSGTGAKIRYLDLTTKKVHTLVGPLGSTVNPTGACQDTQVSPAKKPFFKHIQAMILHPTSKNLLVADEHCYAVRQIDTTKSDAVTTIAGQLGVSGLDDGLATTAAMLGDPRGLAITPKGNAIYIADHWKLRLLSGGTVSTVLSSCSPICTRITYAAQTELYSADQNGVVIQKVNALTKSYYLYAGSTAGHADGPRLTAKFSGYLNPVYVGGSTPTLYVAGGKNHLLRKIDINSGVVSTLAGTPGSAGSADGDALKATFNNPWYIAVGSSGEIYIADLTSKKIRKYTPK